MPLPQVLSGENNSTKRAAAWFDVLAVAAIILFGMYFLWNPRGWAPNVYVGNDQFGDSEYWWQGALQFSRAILWDNLNIAPGSAYRMGYALFAGLLIALFGPEFAVIHKLLLLLFLGIAASGYLILCNRLGRLAALAMTATLVFSPYQAEWLAISTSDSLGLIWNLISLLALFLALNGRIRLRWLMVAGMFLSLGALTRPLMTLLICPAILFILLKFSASFRMRSAAIGVLIAAFTVPSVVWATANYFHAGTFASASNDGSIFYAASNPKIQVWDSSIYGPVEQAAQARLGLPSVPDVQMNQEFRYEALVNYRDQWAYHLRRLPQHIMALARFSYHGLNPGDRLDANLRWLVRGLLGIGLVILCLVNRSVLRAALVIGVCVLSFWTRTAGWVVVASAILCLLPGRNDAMSQIHRLTAAYWWAGVAALYFAGGTWGPPVVTQFGLHALGYRLGLQFLFANEWLVILALVAVAGVPSTAIYPSVFRRFRPWFASAASATTTLKAAGYAAIVVLACVLISGGTIIGFRGWQDAHAAPIRMPSLRSVVSAICVKEGDLQPQDSGIEAEPAVTLQRMWAESFDPVRRLEGTYVFTGMSGGLIWQFPWQERTRLILHQQDQQFPYIFRAARTHIEISGLIDEPSWRYRQGAWIIRSFREVGPVQASVYYESLPKVQVFVPLSADGRSFDTAHMSWFPLARYASALAYAGKLRSEEAQLEWMQYPTTDNKRRWFLLMPPASAQTGRKSGVEIETSDLIAPSKLSFDFRVEPLPESVSNKEQVKVTVESVDATGGRRTLIERGSPSRGAFVDVPTDHVAIDIPANAARLNVTFSNLGAREYVRVVEMTVTSLDVKPGLQSEYCAPGKGH